MTLFTSLSTLIVSLLSLYWNCQLITYTGGGGVYVAGTGVEVIADYKIDLVCWETEGNVPGGAPTGNTMIINIK